MPPLRSETALRSTDGVVVSLPALGLPSPGTVAGFAATPEVPDGFMATGLLKSR